MIEYSYNLNDWFNKKQVKLIDAMLVETISQMSNLPPILNYKEEKEVVDNYLKTYKTFTPPKKDIDLGSCHNTTFFDIGDNLMNELLNEFEMDSIRNYSLYHKHSIINWHTNSDQQGTRYYVHYNFSPGSFFAIYAKGKVKVYEEKEGWNIKRFKIPKDGLLWHSAYSAGYRFTIGFNKLENKKV